MQTLKSKTQLKISWQKQSLLVVAFVLLLALSAQFKLDNSSTLSFTLQTLVIGVFYYYLGRNWKLAGILLYLVLGIAGIAVFSNGQSGWDYFSSEVLGFFLGFVAAAFVRPSQGNYQNHFVFFILIHAVILAIGLVLWSIYEKSLDPILVTSIVLMPGMIIKSLLGALITWGLSKRIKQK